MKFMQKGHGKKVMDYGFAEFLNLLDYIASQFNTKVIRIDKFYPSSQLCHECGYQNPGVKSRPVRKDDLEQFDLVVGMDRENLRDLKRRDKRGQWEGKIVPMCFFTTRFLDEEVPDPYYGGQEGFDHVVELLQDGCANLLENLKEQLS